MAIMELSRRWDLGRDVFFLQINELEEYEGRKDDLQQKIKSRKLRWQSARRLDMPEVIDSKDMGSLGLPKKYDAATELKGEPIASGISTGLARLVKDPSEAADLGKGYVLVCHSTDPGWTALFVNARGLVVEQGGILSHGAIVARDFGIPAVVCADAMRRIPDRATVRVDGNRGLIAIVKQSGEEGKGP
jgi:pyruvate,water dikinase